MSEPIVRWNEQVEAFFVDYGNIRFSVGRNSCAELIAALERAYHQQAINAESEKVRADIGKYHFTGKPIDSECFYGYHAPRCQCAPACSCTCHSRSATQTATGNSEKIGKVG